jgi:hypothetical protein
MSLLLQDQRGGARRPTLLALWTLSLHLVRTATRTGAGQTTASAGNVNFTPENSISFQSRVVVAAGAADVQAKGSPLLAGGFQP